MYKKRLFSYAGYCDWNFFFFVFADKLSNGGTAMKAEALQIVTTGEGHTFVLDEDTLTEVLLQNDIKDRFVVIVSVAGAFRKGKSFILDFFLRYMYSKVFLASIL